MADDHIQVCLIPAKYFTTHEAKIDTDALQEVGRRMQSILEQKILCIGKPPDWVIISETEAIHKVNGWRIFKHKDGIWYSAPEADTPTIVGEK